MQRTQRKKTNIIHLKTTTQVMVILGNSSIQKQTSTTMNSAFFYYINNINNIFVNIEDFTAKEKTKLNC